MKAAEVHNLSLITFMYKTVVFWIVTTHITLEVNTNTR
jgi:hypothetical protein